MEGASRPSSTRDASPVAPLNARLDRPLLSVGTVRDRCYGPAEGTTGGSEGGLASPGEESTLAMDESVRGDRMSLSESRMRRVFVEPSGSDDRHVSRMHY